ncbi:hypothetical protein SAMN05446037_100263 [Anaerovirgula multivorans]|uniref:Phage-related protein n=1 Tax=Anaerovirgula multivorans TaxID=312168 RepID=A0A239AKI8_9FIRM|nr:hypothetical protein [Anaerovirgula multivorans]SNR95433.1 hypothetical protein SAMN05446037_100263 [Anaerovirgula multivorans]
MIAIATVGELALKIIVDDKGLDKGIGNAENKSKNLAKTFGTVAKAAAGVTAGIIAAGGAMFGMAKKAADATDRVDKMSQQLGMTRRGFQEWDFIMSQSGASIDSMGAGMRSLTNAMTGTGAGAAALDRLKVSTTTLNGEMKTQEQLFEDVVIALQGMEEGAEKAKLANELFGRSGQELMPLLNGAAGSVEEMKQRAEELGLVLGDEAIDAGVLFADTMDQVKRSLGSVATQVGVAVMPVIQSLLEWILEHMPTIQAVFSKVFGVIETVVTTAINIFNDYLMPVFQMIFDWVQENMPEIQETFSSVFGIIGDIIKAFVDLAMVLWNAFGKDIMKVTEVIWKTIWKVIENVLNVIKGILDFWIGLFTGDWDRMAKGIESIWSGLWNTIKTIVSGAWSALSTAFASLYRNITGWFTGVAKDAYNWGKNMIKGFVDGIKSMGSAVSKAASDTVKKAADYLKFWSPAKFLAC